MFEPRRLGRALLAGAAAAASAAVLASAFSARADPFAVIEGEALDVSADRLEVDVEHGSAELRGNVTARLGEIEVHCPGVEIRYDKSPRVSWLRGTGGVTARLKGIDATATTVEFDASSRKVALHGSVRLSRGRGWLTAEHATIDVASGKVSLQEVKGSIPVDPSRK
jgi:lipopolysaccharide transport protein LptA